MKLVIKNVFLDDVDEIIESMSKDQLNSLRHKIRIESARWKPFE